MKENRTKTTQKNLKDVKVWFRSGYVKADGTCAIMLMVYMKNKRVVFNTGVSVGIDFWDIESESIKKNHEKAKDYNLIIDNCKARINDIFVRYRLQHKELTPELLKKEYLVPSIYIDFYAWLRKTIQARRGSVLKETTYKQHLVLISKLESFKKDLTFAEIDEQFINNFTAWLKRSPQNNNVGTVHNTLKKFKTYIHIAIRDKIINTNPFEHVKMIRSYPDRDFLSESELNSVLALYKKNILPFSQQIVLRHFLFQCFTGLRISDVRQVKFENIINNMLVFTAVKSQTTKPITLKIPLCAPALKLIKDENTREHGYIFKLLAEQTINRLLKEIISRDDINIKKKITTHSGRHTFATIFLKKTKNIVALKELLGHSNIQTTMVYAHLLTDDLISEMKTFDEFKF